MPRATGAALLALLISSAAVLPADPVSAVAVPGVDQLVAVPRAVLGSAVQSDEPIERRLGGAARGVVREVRRSARTIGWMFGRAVNWWGNWIKRAAFYIAVAIVAALADASLVNAWRLEGLRALAAYVPMMLYVYARLLFSSGVHLAPKIMLVGAIVYGMVWRDLLPDRRWIPGRLEDIVLIVIATRAFVYACPEELLDRYADRAVRLRRRMTLFQRASR